jgi:hypothetical protein
MVLTHFNKVSPIAALCSGMRKYFQKMVAVLSAGVALGCGSEGLDEGAEAWSSIDQEVVQTGVTYNIVGVHSGKCVEIAGGSTANGAAVQIATCNGSARQQFRFESMGSGYHRIRNVGSNRCIDINAASMDDGASVIQWDCHSNPNQQFLANDRGNTVHELFARHSGKALDVNARSTADGTPLIQWASNGGTNQQFRLTPVEGGGGGTGTCGSGAFHAEVVQSGSSWVVRNGSGAQLGTDGDLLAAMRRAVSSLTPGRTSKQKVIVRASGSVPANQSLDLPSYTIFESCGTITATGGGSGDNAPIRIRNANHVDVTHLRLAGAPNYGIFVRRSSHLHFGQIHLGMSGGMGMRIDNDPANNCWGRCNRLTNIRIDNVFVSGTSNHGVETYGVDGLTIGTVTARNVGNAGLLLNATVNATVNLVDAEDTASGTGYAAFRVANEAGKIGSSWPAGNIRVGQVRSRRGGRGIFCVSDSGGTTIDRVDIAGAGNNSILLENCHNTRIGAVGGTISGGGEVRISQRSNEHTPTSNITLQNLTITGTGVRESPCAINTVVCNVSAPTFNVCSGTRRTTCP